MYKTIGKKFRRALHFDFHTPPTIDNIFGNFDAEHFADQLADAHVEYINFFARCNMGFSYYNTKVGKKYEGLGERDVLKEVIDACHKRSIGVTAYLNIGLDHEFAADNPGWNKILKDGRVYKDDKSDNFFRVMCYNSPYREHLISEIKEITKYDIDGLFCDCVTLRACYCPKCMKEMIKLGYDPESEESATEYQNKVRKELCMEIRNLAPDKELKFYFNGMDWDSRWQTQTEIECLVTGVHWGYDYFASSSALARTLFSDRVYMSGRFQNDWGDFGGIKPLASMQNDLYDAMMNSFGLSYGDHLHPVDGFENEVAERVKAVFEEKMLYEPYTENSENLVDVGVLVEHGTRKMPPYIKGMARMLKELKVQYNIYHEDGDFETLPLLIVGDDIKASEMLKERLKRYLANGGKMLFAGAGVDLGVELGALDFIESCEKDDSDNAFYTTSDEKMRWAMYLPSRLIKNKSGREMAKYISKYFNLIWDGRQAYFYRPQNKPTDYSAAVVDKNAGCICFDIFRAYAENFLSEHKHLFKSMIDELLPNRLILSNELPQTTTTAITRNAKHTVFHIKTTYPEIRMNRGIIEEHNYMKSASISLLGEHKVYALPDMTEISTTVDNGRTVFETGDILGYKAFLIK